MTTTRSRRSLDATGRLAGLVLLLLAVAPGLAAGGPIVVTGPESGGGPDVRVFDALSGELLMSFFAFDPGFLGGVRVGSVDANQDGIPDVIVAAGPGGGPHLRVLDGAALLRGELLELTGIFAYDPGLRSGMFIAGGNGAPVPSGGDIAGVTAGPGLAGGGTTGTVTVSLMPCPASSVLKASGPGAWTCGTDSDAGGDITAVTAGAGLTGGGSSGAVTLAVDTALIQARVTGACPAGQYVQAIGATGLVTCGADANSGGTLTGVTAGEGLAGTPNPITGTGTLAVAFGGSGAAATVARSDHHHDAAYWKLGGNAGTTPGTHFLGTTDDQALELRVNGLRALRLEPGGTDPGFGSSPNLVAGLAGNVLTAAVAGATIAGGGGTASVCGPSGSDPCTNRVTDNFGTVGGGAGNQAGDGGVTDDSSGATVGGGLGNTASGFLTTVGGGTRNTASGSGTTVGGGVGNTASGQDTTVGGGAGNTASNGAAVAGGTGNNATGTLAVVGGGTGNTADQQYATVSGGSGNAASNYAATVSGGEGNTASGTPSTVAGGMGNTASGNLSFAAGRQAKAIHRGAFVWADSNSLDFPSTVEDELSVRATGGMRVVLTVDGTTGAPLWTCSVVGGASWACSSDRNLKENLVLVDGPEILRRLGQVPIFRWNARGMDPAVTHVGPTAQDFHAAFGLGNSDRLISTIDADGIAMAAIQALHEKSLALEAQVRAFEARLAEMDALQARLAALERVIETRGLVARPAGAPGR